MTPGASPCRPLTSKNSSPNSGASGTSCHLQNSERCLLPASYPSEQPQSHSTTAMRVMRCVAAPILHANKHPATFFLTTGAIGSEREFWWDELATFLVEMCVPVTGLITVGAKQFEIDFAAPLVPAEILKAWHWTSPSQHVRLQNYMDIWMEMRALTHTAQRAALDSMWQACSERPILRDNYRPLTTREVKTLEVAGLFHIAPHSATHAALSGLPEEAQRFEIVSSLEACATLSNNTIAIFSYPYGDNSLITRRIVHESGFTMACGTEPRVVNATSDPFAIPRFQVPDLPSLVL